MFAMQQHVDHFVVSDDHSRMRMSTRRRTNWQTETWCRVTRESDSRRLRHPGEQSSTHSCERSKARKTGAQLRHSRRSAKNDAKCVKKAHHRCHWKVKYLPHTGFIRQHAEEHNNPVASNEDAIHRVPKASNEGRLPPGGLDDTATVTYDPAPCK